MPTSNDPAKGNLHESFTHIAPKRRLAASHIRQQMADADPALLLLSVVHITGRLDLLDHYAPLLKPVAKADIAPGLKVVETMLATATSMTIPTVARDELIEMAIEALDRDPAEQKDYLTGYDLDPELFIKMASIAAGGAVDPEYANMYREQMGFVRPLPVLPQSGKPTDRIELAIIGAGMTGLAAGLQAMDRGFNFQIFERDDKIGGVWNVNDYPGVAVDTPAGYYSLSYELKSDWTNYFPKGAEYYQYLASVVDKYKLEEKIRFNSEIIKLAWIESDQEWELTVVSGGRDASKIRATAVMTCMGHLNRPLYPDLQGRENFKGVSMHANRWDYDVDLSGKRVGIIGTGATGVQIVGAIAQDVGHLTVFQRQPMWMAPNQAGDGVVAESKIWARTHFPYFMHWNRMKDYWTFSDNVGYPIVRADPEWARNNLSISPANDSAMQFFLGYIKSCFGEGTELAAKMTPTYAPLGKRIVRDPYDFAPGGFYYALTRPNVDVETAKLARVAPDGILTVDGKLIELDVIIYATGMTLDWLSPIEIVGRDGIRLSEAWRDNNPSSYIGGLVPGYPNLFVNSGPNTGAAHAGGHNFMAEVVNHYVMECLQLLVEEDARSIEVTQEAFDAYNAELDAKMEDSIWAWERRANTYYTNQKGRIIMPTPWRHVEVWEMTREPRKDAFILR
jgi:4-hydroxyacetophenone monooxygenase